MEPISKEEVAYAFLYSHNTYHHLIVDTANRFLNKIHENPEDALKCAFTMKDIHHSATHIIIEAVGFLMFERHHAMNYQIDFIHTGDQSAAHKKMGVNDAVKGYAEVRVVITPSGYFTKAGLPNPTLPPGEEKGAKEKLDDYVKQLQEKTGLSE